MNQMLNYGKQKNNETQNGSRQNDDSGRAMFALTLIMLIGLFVIAAYSFKTPNWLKVSSILIMITGASVLLGALLGFLFGIPRSSQIETASSASTTSGQGTSQGATHRGPDYRPNTNLEQISDWLTKILVGVGLTQITVAPQRFRELAEIISHDLPGTEVNPSLLIALILFYSISGFLFCYLWTRLFLPGALITAERELYNLFDQLSSKAEKAFKKADVAESAALLGIGGKREKAAKRGVSFIAEEIAPGQVADDPWKEQFGGQSSTNFRQLQADITKIPDRENYYLVRLTVTSTDPIDHPLRGSVKFFLHPTFTNDKPIVDVSKKGVAELRLTAWGAFTVGALADEGRTKLELDLAELESAPVDFRSR